MSPFLTWYGKLPMSGSFGGASRVNASGVRIGAPNITSYGEKPWTGLGVLRHQHATDHVASLLCTALTGPLSSGLDHFLVCTVRSQK
ncbi:hypothetical protein ONE63_003512 [Megalurothrips usitatus]|uniref:Uncharacterized protein n=1 Tax=Megalurothrips usitatus TaxID=439358 RepID=A0AAV7X752_9NEOP|nr:hypothetical protein ONE63_003512 [Megalurothrips usitatus]